DEDRLSHTLTPGQQVSKALRRGHQTPRLHCIGPLNLVMHYPHKSGDERPQRIRYDLKWLGDDEAQIIRLDSDLLVIDVDTMDPEITIPAQGQETQIYLSAGSSLVSVRICPQEARAKPESEKT